MARVALVTGGTRGIGAAISKALKAAGYKVAANYAGNDEAAQTRSRPRPASRSSSGTSATSTPARPASSQVEAELGPVDVLVNNAGITRDGFFHKMTQRPVVGGHPHQPRLRCSTCTRPVIEGMRNRSFGRIIVISSINGQKGQIGQANYSAAKAGDIGFVKALAQESAAKGITVNVIAPGYIGTEMVQAIDRGRAEDQDHPADPGRPPRRGRRRSPARSCSWPPTRPASSPARRSRPTAASTWPEVRASGSPLGSHLSPRRSAFGPSSHAPRPEVRPASEPAEPRRTQTLSTQLDSAAAETRPTRMSSRRRDPVRVRRDPAVVVAGPVHGGVRDGAAVPAGGHDLRDRRRHRGAAGSLRPRAARAAWPSPGRSGCSGSAACSAITRSISRRCARPAGRGRAGALSLAAADRAVLRALARRAARTPLHWSAPLIGLRRRGGADRRRAGCRSSAGATRRGYACALLGAFVWSGYSVLSRRFGAVPTDAVAGFCLAAARCRCALPSRLRDDRLAGGRERMARDRSGSGSGRSGRRSTCGTSA